MPVPEQVPGHAPEQGHAVTLLAGIADRSVVVGVIGQGYVGLPLALRVRRGRLSGHRLRRRRREGGGARPGRELHTPHRPGAGGRRAFPRTLARRPAFAATTDFSRLADCDAILICVPTPLGKHREPDMSYVHGTAARDRPASAPRPAGGPGVDHLPGHHRRGGPAPARGRRAAHPGDFLLAFSPEREDPGNRDFSTRTIPKIVGGVNAESTRSGRRPLRSGGGTGGAGVLGPRGRGGQAAREHLPGGQHRPGERAEDDLRPHGHRHLGGHRGGQDQALRLSGLLSPGRAWAGTASPWTRSTSPGRRRSTACGPASSSWPARSTPACPPGWCRRWPRR